MPLEVALAPVQHAPGEPQPIEKLFQFAKKGALGLSDQALFSGANFLVNILLARWLAPAEYGAFCADIVLDDGDDPQSIRRALVDVLIRRHQPLFIRSQVSVPVRTCGERLVRA